MENLSPQQDQGDDLQVEISASPNPVRVRHRLTLTMLIRNAGPTTATGVAIRQTLPPHIILQSVRSSEGTCMVMDDVVTCEIGTMAPGSTVTVTVVVRPLRAGPLVDSEVAAAAFQPNPANNGNELTVLVIPLGAAGIQP